MIPGVGYTARVYHKERLLVPAAAKLGLRPGEVRDLGDVRAGPGPGRG